MIFFQYVSSVKLSPKLTCSTVQTWPKLAQKSSPSLPLRDAERGSRGRNAKKGNAKSATGKTSHFAAVASFSPKSDLLRNHMAMGDVLHFPQTKETFFAFSF